MRECPTCHQQTPEGHFCVRCGAPLDQQLESSRGRRQFAVAPDEHRYAPWLVSTLFPQLPRHSDRHFRIALLCGAAVVIVLGALRLFGVALISAALLMPLLTVLYFYDADIYESEPAWAATWTVVWGGLTGVGVGLLAKATAPTGPALIDKGSTAHVVTGGILLPTLGVLLMLAGPVVLLRYRLFNEALDGASFGAASAATFAGAEAIVVGAGVIGGGLRPIGAPAPWVERLVGLAVATPVLSMSAVGAATAAVWLRYRAPVKDRGALGVLGFPPVAVAVALALVITGAVGETFLPAGAWLAWLAVLDACGLVLLRRALHVGLLEEAAERDIGPQIRCANCGAATASHTFCGNCGVALKALPKVRAADPAAAAESRGSFAGRLSAGLAYRRLLAYGAALAAIVGIAVGVGALSAPPGPKPRCRPGTICGSPPVVAHALFTFSGDTAWQSTGLGFALRYQDDYWSVASRSADGVALQSSDGNSTLYVDGMRASRATPAAALAAKLAALQGKLLGVARDTDPADQVLGPNVGLIAGAGAVYTGVTSTPQGPQTPVTITLMAARSSGVTIVATLVTPDTLGPESAVAQKSDDVINSIVYSSP